MDEITRAALRSLIEYNEADELHDWLTQGEPTDHIIHDIRKLKLWLCTYSPEPCPNACNCGCDEGLYICRCEESE